MVRSLLLGHADLSASSVTLSAERFMAVDFLYPLGTETYAIYISNPGREALNWDIYRQPFTRELWIFLIVAALALAVCVRGINAVYATREKKRGSTPASLKFLGDVWSVFSSYLGGRPSTPPPDTRWGSRFLMLSILLTGNVVFMSYRAAVTSDLAVWSIKLPFHDLIGLLSVSNMA